MVSGRALSLLIKRGNTSATVPVSQVDEIVAPNAVECDGQATDAVGHVRDKKRNRLEKDLHPSKKHSHVSQSSGNLTAGKTLALGTSPRDVVPEAIPIAEKPGSIMIEIGPEARWNVGDRQPVQVFGAFRLARDSQSYEGFSRDEVILRSRRRLGMFISDYERILAGMDEEVKEACDRETLALRKELSESNQRFCDLASREEKAARRYEAEAKSRAEEKEKLDKQINDLEVELGRFRLNGEEFKKERDEARSRNIALAGEVTALKKSLAEGDEELVQSLASGYNACLDRLVAAGVSCDGHSFEDYCATLRAEETGGGNKE